jgi:hypothetical protein
LWYVRKTRVSAERDEPDIVHGSRVDVTTVRKDKSAEERVALSARKT